MSFKIGDPVIFEAQNRLVPWGSLGTVIDIKTQSDGTWVTAKFDDKEYTMKKDDRIFNLDLDEIRKERDALRAEVEELKERNNQLVRDQNIMAPGILKLRAALERIVRFNPSYEYTFENARSIAKEALGIK